MTDAQGNSYGPYDVDVVGSEAEALTETAFFELFGHITGVKSGGALTFAGLTATLAPINMRVFGSYLVRTAAWSDASPATTGASPRRDLLVARRQRTSGSGPGAIPGKTFLTVLRGTPAATPADPTTFDLVNDEPLWSWQVPASGGTVVTNITDRRRFLTPAGGRVPQLIAEDTNVAMGAVGNGVGYVLAASLSVPAHRPGLLRCRYGGSWVAPNNAAAFAKLQFPAGTDVPGSTSRGHGSGFGNVPVPVDCDGYIVSDGTARTLGLYLSADSTGVSISGGRGNFQVWLLDQ